MDTLNISLQFLKIGKSRPMTAAETKLKSELRKLTKHSFYPSYPWHYVLSHCALTIQTVLPTHDIMSLPLSTNHTYRPSPFPPMILCLSHRPLINHPSVLHPQHTRYHVSRFLNTNLTPGAWVRLGNQRKLEVDEKPKSNRNLAVLPFNVLHSLSPFTMQILFSLLHHLCPFISQFKSFCPAIFPFAS